MNKDTLIKEINKTNINEERVVEIEKIYGILPEFIKKMASYLSDSIFLDGCRLLSYSELKDAPEELGIEFKKLQIVPLLDCFDNDYIVYNLKTNRWNKFNIGDGCLFDEKIYLEDIVE